MIIVIARLVLKGKMNNRKINPNYRAIDPHDNWGHTTPI